VTTSRFEVPAEPLSAVYRYHDGTKHHFHAFARSLGYLDWASQPAPFRAYRGAPEILLQPNPDAQEGHDSPIGDLFRHALGLSAWKRHGRSRWPLRVNPSSGNLHPTEAYLVCGAVPGLSSLPAVYHYAADRHALEQRCVFGREEWLAATAGGEELLLVALTSIHWRESWKYGERAFRYCQHDLGHAIGALGIAAALHGWTTTPVTGLSHAVLAAIAGVDRDDDFFEAEREEPGCLLAIAPAAARWELGDGRRLAAAVGNGRWTGRATQLSEDHVQWTFIDEIAAATASDGNAPAGMRAPGGIDVPVDAAFGVHTDVRRLVLQRRSALAFDGHSTMAHQAFRTVLGSALTAGQPWWPVLAWEPHVHLAILVHRVESVPAGLYMLVRNARSHERLRDACGRDFLWERSDERLPLFCLAQRDCRAVARRLSCDQEIAADGFFSLGMIAEFADGLQEFGPGFYRQLFWETGVIGQMLYVSAEAAGARATGIGCFYDDPVHEVLGVRDHAVQSLYHFSVGMPVDDARLTTEPGYSWEPVGHTRARPEGPA
jgi:SagB-type dehydrogenase family enzyme